MMQPGHDVAGMRRDAEAPGIRRHRFVIRAVAVSIGQRHAFGQEIVDDRIDARNFRCQRDQLQFALTIGDHLLRRGQRYLRPAGADPFFPDPVQPWTFAVDTDDICAFVVLVRHFADAADHGNRAGWENAGDALGTQSLQIMPDDRFLHLRIRADLSG